MKPAKLKKSKRQKQKVLSDPLQFMKEHQPKPSESKVYVLKSTYFRCFTCVDWHIRCENCILLVSDATKEFVRARTRVEAAVTDYERALSSESHVPRIREYMMEAKNQKIRDKLANLRQERDVMHASVNDAKSRFLGASSLEEDLRMDGTVPVGGGQGNVPDAVASGSVPLQVGVSVDESDLACVNVLFGGLREEDWSDAGAVAIPSVVSNFGQQSVPAGDNDWILDEFADDAMKGASGDGDGGRTIGLESSK